MGVIMSKNTNRASITILYDNSRHTNCSTSAWGFSCLVEYDSVRVLFDTGSDGETLFANTECLEVDLTTLDAVVLSHFHWDHCGGIYSVLHRCHSKPSVYLLDDFSTHFVEDIERLGSAVHVINRTTRISRGILATGPVQSVNPYGIKEQGLILEAGNSRVLVTGCAHPGILNMVDSANDSLGEHSVSCVIGGFHLMNEDRNSVKRTILMMRERGVRSILPTHCTGAEAIRQFRDIFGEGYIQGGVGRKISLDELVY